MRQLPDDAREYRYAIRPLLLFKKFGIQNVFFVEAAYNHLLKHEKVTYQAIRDSLLKSEALGLISITKYHYIWIKRNKERDSNFFDKFKLSGTDKNRNLYYFSHTNILNLEKIFGENLLCDEDYPIIAQALLMEDVNKSSSRFDEDVLIISRNLVRE